jgi:DNA polymerase (family 10)
MALKRGLKINEYGIFKGTEKIASKCEDSKRLLRQIGEIDRLNQHLKGITVLKSAEVDILEDGSLDLPDEVLEKLDFTVCAVHSHFHLSKKRQTERIIRAMENPNFTILAHPTGRMIGSREPIDINFEKIIL